MCLAANRRSSCYDPPGLTSQLPQEIEVPCRRWSDLRTFRDVSLQQGFVFIRGSAPGPTATPLVVTLSLPDGRKLRFRGQVGNVLDAQAAAAHGRAAGFQVMFEPLDENQWQWVNRQVQTQDPEPDPALVEWLTGEAARLEGLDPYALLAIKRQCTQKDVDDARASFAQQWHPARYSTAPYEARQLVALIGQLGEAAYARLETAELRAETLAALCAGQSMRTQIPADLPEEGRRLGADHGHLLEQVRVAQRAQRWDESVRLYRLALKDEPDSKMLQGGFFYAQAQQALQGGDVGIAMQRCQQAVAADERNVDAVRLLRKLTEQESERSKSGLRNLFRKKK